MPSWFGFSKNKAVDDGVSVNKTEVVTDGITEYRSMDEIEAMRTDVDMMPPVPLSPTIAEQSVDTVSLPRVLHDESSTAGGSTTVEPSKKETALIKSSSEVPVKPSNTCKAACAACCVANASSPIFWGIFITLGVSLGAGYLLSTSQGGHYRDYNVAFVGNYYLAVNDIPRMMVELSKETWTQQSCLHTRGSLATILETGNGMYNKWNGKYNAYMNDEEVYDFGACTVEQLFTSNDVQLSYQDENGAYYDDGRNPCFLDDDYWSWNYNLGVTSGEVNATVDWDFVILSDQPKRMAFEYARNASKEALEFSYSAYLEDIAAIPIIVSPHAFDSESTNMTGLGNIPEFTSMIHAGAKEYAASLEANLPWRLAPRIAPVSLAFLTVYEEDVDLWSLLTDADDIHASVYGTYLTACVIFATVNQKMPPKDFGEIKALFAVSRSLSGRSWGYPSSEEAEYLWEVTNRIVFRGFTPSTLNEI